MENRFRNADTLSVKIRISIRGYGTDKTDLTLKDTIA